jgi:hypothetical protein
VKVYSGIAPPPALLDAMAAEGKIHSSKSDARNPRPSDNGDIPPPKPQRPSTDAPVPSPAAAAQPEEGYDDAPPSYEDAMADGIGPVDGPRREYNPPNASAERRPPGGPVTDVKAPVDSMRDHDAFHGHRSSRESSESLDMLPTTPGSRPESRGDSLLDEPGATHTPLEQPPKGEHFATPGAQQQQRPGIGQQDQPSLSRPNIRTGVPSRRPVPGSRGPSGASQS